MVQQEILSRLACAKYIFLTGIETLDRGAPFASGLAVLAFQDAAEMVLRAIAEHLHAPIKESTAFNQLIEEIDKVSPSKITHRSALNQLNKARVNFKHMGLAPRDEDVRKFRSDLEGFFPSALKSILNIDYERISLTSLITRIRIRKWMQDAEGGLAGDDYQKGVACSAVALELYLRTRNARDRGLDLKRAAAFSPDTSTLSILSAMCELAETVERQFVAIDQQLDLIGNGVSYGDYQRFLALSPAVLVMSTGVVDVSFHRYTPYTYDEALFCFTFVQNVILKLQNQYAVVPRFAPHATGRILTTISHAQVIVSPMQPGEEPEVLMDLAPGSKLEECSAGYQREGFRTVLVDGECAYISADTVRYIDEGVGDP